MDLEKDVILVGIKPGSVYAFAVKTIFDNGEEEVIIKARGKQILKAINLVEFMKRNGQLEIKEITTGNEKYNGKDEREVYISSIEIKVVKR